MTEREKEGFIESLNTLHDDLINVSKLINELKTWLIILLVVMGVEGGAQVGLQGLSAVKSSIFPQVNAGFIAGE